MMSIQILFFSISGNTRAFVKKLSEYATTKHEEDASKPLVTFKEITDDSLFEEMLEPFFAFVPTYLDGGNGAENGTNEIMTNTLSEFIEFKDNRQKCLGVVGSGNKNFNWQYCLTAKQYAERFDVPMVDDFELRGTPTDVERVYENLIKYVV